MSEASQKGGDVLGERGSLREVAALFLRLGFIAFGGPAAHIALMHDEVVKRRRWISERHFLDLLGATNLIPGPNSTEMAIQLGFTRACWPGMVVAGALFVLPAMSIVMAVAYAYAKYGSMPQATWLLYAVKPVIIAIVIQALFRLSRTAVKGVLTGAVGCAVIPLYLVGVNEIALLLGAGVLMMLLQNGPRVWANKGMGMLIPGSLLPWNATGLAVISAAAVPFSYGTLFLTFLKIGAVLYGSGYVLLAFLRGDFVERLGWLTDQQLLDAIAIGQFTPGPVLTTATFVGYLVGGWPGAILATVGIFLPSFLFVAMVHPLIPRLRGSLWASAFLDGVNVAAIGLMAAVTWQLGHAAIVDPFTTALGLVSLAVLLRFKLNSAWLVLGGALVGAAGGLLAASLPGAL